MNKPRLLDLFCCAGGAARGYADAGFEVVGVDIEDQPNYPFARVLGNALDVWQTERGCWHHPNSAHCLGEFDAIHASPPCQAYSDLAKLTKREYPRLIGPIREILRRSGLPYIIENVEGAPLENSIMLCGTMFPELRVIRHRIFESNIVLLAPGAHPPHPLVYTRDKRKGHYGLLDEMEAYVQVTGGGNCSKAAAADAMGIDWMTKDELNEAIPPAYTEWLGKQLLRALEVAA